MAMTKDEMREYQRQRREKLKAGVNVVAHTVPVAVPNSLTAAPKIAEKDIAGGPGSTYEGHMRDKILPNLDTRGWGAEAKLRYEIDKILQKVAA